MQALLVSWLHIGVVGSNNKNTTTSFVILLLISAIVLSQIL